MMVNCIGDNDEYRVITLDLQEPFAEKILELLSHKETLEILNLTQDPCTAASIYAKTEHSQATLYRRISNLLDVNLLFAVGREESNLGKYGGWIYVKSFYVLSMRCGKIAEEEDNGYQCTNTVIEILPKRKFYGQILRTVRNCRL